MSHDQRLGSIATSKNSTQSEFSLLRAVFFFKEHACGWNNPPQGNGNKENVAALLQHVNLFHQLYFLVLR